MPCSRIPSFDGYVRYTGFIRRLCMKQYVYDFYGENELEEVIDRFRQERREKAGLFITL